MQILIIGATGHLGCAVALRFAAAGWQVLAQSRREALPLHLRHERIALQRGDGLVAGDIAAAARGADVIVDAAAPYPVDPYLRGGPSFAAVAAAAERRAQALVDIAAANGAVLVGLGSFVTHRPRAKGSGAVRRRLSTWLRARHPYFAVKERIEARLRRAADAGQPVVILNPTGCLGPWDIKSPRLALVPRLLEGSLPASVGDVVNFIDVRDVADAVVAAIEARHFGVPTLLSGHNAGFDDVIADLCSYAGVRRPLLRAPAILGLPAVLAAEKALGLLERPSPIPALTLAIVLECGAVAISDAQRALGLTPRPWRETVQSSVDWVRSDAYRAALGGDPAAASVDVGVR